MNILSRRTFLIGTGLAFPVVAVKRSFLTAEAQDVATGLAGRVAEVLPGAVTVDVKHEGGRSSRHRVVVASSSRISRGTDGPVSDLSSFLVGEELAAEGEWQGSTLVAASVGSTFEAVHALLTGLDDQTRVASTDAGPLSVEQLKTGPGRIGRYELAIGDHLDGLIWSTPTSPLAQLVLAVREKI